MKSKTKPKQDSYVVLQRWMRTELGLKGNELTVYAIIYGFSQDGESVYKGGYGYLADWTGLSENGARNIVKDLVARGLLKEHKTMVGGILVNQYVAVRNPTPETVPEDAAHLDFEFFQKPACHKLLDDVPGTVFTQACRVGEVSVPAFIDALAVL